MNDPLPTHLACSACATRFELTHIFEAPSEFMLTIAGNLCCPICCEGWLNWDDDIPMPEAFADFIMALDL